MKLFSRAYYMDLYNGLPEIKDTEPDLVMIAEYNSIIFTIPSENLTEMVLSSYAK